MSPTFVLPSHLIVLSVSAALHVAAYAVSAHAGRSSAVPAWVDVALENIEPAALPIEPLPVEEEPTPIATHAAPDHVHAYPVAPSHDARPHDPSLVHAPVGLSAPPAGPAPAPAVLQADAPASFKITIDDAPTSPGGFTSAASGPTAAAAPLSSPTVFSESRVSSPARLLSSAPPRYPPDARASEVEADVALEIVVDAGGHVMDARVTKRAGFGFDDAALAAVRTYRFAPAQHEGRAVGVRMRWSVSFRLR